jgi:predicted acyltransferase (DUF342 family)
MTDIVASTDILIGYNKFLELRIRQATANKKYRATEHGRIKTIEIHRAWINKKKGDVEYKKNTNLKQRERYYVRKSKILEEAKKIAELAANDISLGEIDSQKV